MKLILYHGTNIALKEINTQSWFAANRWHALKLADRRTKQRGGQARVYMVSGDPRHFVRVPGRDNPVYRSTRIFRPQIQVNLHHEKINKQ